MIFFGVEDSHWIEEAALYPGIAVLGLLRDLSHLNRRKGKVPKPLKTALGGDGQSGATT